MAAKRKSDRYARKVARRKLFTGLMKDSHSGYKQYKKHR